MKSRFWGTLEPQAKFFIQNTWKTEQLLLNNISSQMNRKDFLLVKWPHHLLGACKYIESISYWLTVFWHFNSVKFLDFRTQLCTKRKLYASLGYNHRWACQIHLGGDENPKRSLFSFLEWNVMKSTLGYKKCWGFRIRPLLWLLRKVGGGVPDNPPSPTFLVIDTLESFNQSYFYFIKALCIRCQKLLRFMSWSS